MVAASIYFSLCILRDKTLIFVQKSPHELFLAVEARIDDGNIFLDAKFSYAKCSSLDPGSANSDPKPV